MWPEPLAKEYQLQLQQPAFQLTLGSEPGQKSRERPAGLLCMPVPQLDSSKVTARCWWENCASTGLGMDEDLHKSSIA